MYLKSIEIQGFKSFANKIVFDFHNGITGIVGPNGSGKSNVADAVRWVLGEQKNKQLRGSKMEDVIFSGTENRKALGFAFVAITMDNSDKKLDIDYDEVTVSRRLYRSGESEYMLNGTQCRLKDINELFYDTGIGKEGYSIIGQGQIDKILSSKPEDRRELFDEAAGIVKFKRRKNASVKKLNDENQNLVRVGDILGELEKQVGPLEKQAETAKEYLALRDRLKAADVNMFLLEAESIKAKSAELDEKHMIAAAQMDAANRSLEEAKNEYAKLDSEIEQIVRGIDEKKSILTDIAVQIEKNEGRVLLLNEQINTARANEERIDEKVTSISENIKNCETKIADLCEQKKVLEVQIQEKTDQLNDTENKLAAVKEKIILCQEETDNYKEKIIDLLNTKSFVKSKIQRCDTLLEQINIRKQEIGEKLVKFESDRNEQESLIADFNEEYLKISKAIEDIDTEAALINKEITEINVSISDISARIENNTIAYHKDKSRLDMLRNITERYEGYGNSIRKIMELKDSKKGIVGVVADIIKADKKYELAIETALGGNIQNVVTDTESTAKELIEFLKKNRYGRATFLPLSSMSNRTCFTNEEALSGRGVLGLACDLIDIKKEYEGVAKYLLGRILVVDNVDNALALARKHRYSLRIVTLEGEFLNAGGSISGGMFKNSGNLLGRRREIDETSGRIRKLKEENESLEKELVMCKSRVSVLNENLDKILIERGEQVLLQNTIKLNLNQASDKKNEIVSDYKSYIAENQNIDDTIADIHRDSESLTRELDEWEEENAGLEKKIEDSDNMIAKLNEEESSLAGLSESIKIEISTLHQKHDFNVSDISRYSQEKTGYEQELVAISDDSHTARDEAESRIRAVNDIRHEIESLKNQSAEVSEQITDLVSKKDRLSLEHKDFFAKREELTDLISGLDREIYRITSQQERMTENYDNKVEYMWNEYEITYSTALKFRDDNMKDGNAVRKQILSLKKEIKQLGDVNVNAIEEYKSVSERYEFLKKQYDDLMEARENLLKIIDELDKGMRRQFEEQFALVNKEFDKVFKELFGGGKGTIELTESDDILDAGINIISQPPGKKLQNMMQLSGGEKALTAISLLFAIQNLKPSPFCLLDEIEAALDGTNVVRFAEYLHKLTENTQFIVITHRRGTMATADRLYGITMQEKGVSALVSVNLTDSSFIDESDIGDDTPREE